MKRKPEYGRILDSRDLESRIDYLESLEMSIKEAKDALDNPEDDDDIEDLKDTLFAAENDLRSELEWDTELSDLREARDEVPEWRSGETIIPESEWVEYCKQLVEDIGDLPKNLPAYISGNIDWKGVAYDLSADYSTLKLNGVEYFFRSV